MYIHLYVHYKLTLFYYFFDKLVPIWEYISSQYYTFIILHSRMKLVVREKKNIKSTVY